MIALARLLVSKMEQSDIDEAIAHRANMHVKNTKLLHRARNVFESLFLVKAPSA